MIDASDSYQVIEVKGLKRFRRRLNKYNLKWTGYKAHDKMFCVAHHNNVSFVYGIQDYKDCCFDVLKYALFQEFTIKNQAK